MEAINDPQEFADKMEWEGGLTGMLDWGGAECFPDELRSLATKAADALDNLRTAVQEYFCDNDVEY